MKSSKLEQQMMTNKNVLTKVSFSGLTALILGLSLGTVGQAKPVLVQRGSHGAYHIVDSENIPLDAYRLPKNEVDKFSDVNNLAPEDNLTKPNSQVDQNTGQCEVCRGC